jgi:nicotinamide mononucleotide (NMN) deamidase PncC/nicotinic acid mononucleotide adenylyltransferase
MNYFPHPAEFKNMSPLTAEDKLSTIYFPLTANPAGNHHLLLVESVLQQFTETKLVIFLLSNGLHPDPFKHQKILPAALRLEMLRSALADWTDSEKSLPAQIAEEAGTSLKLNPNNCAISRCELSLNRPLRFVEHLKNISRTEKIPMIVGADLIERMLNPQIFTTEDLKEIEKGCHLLAAPRNNIELESVLQLVKQKRGVTLTVTHIMSKAIAPNLQKFFLISSTLIRRAAQAGHVLEAYLPKNAARLIFQNSLYDSASHVFNLQTVNMNELQLCCSELERQLEEAAKKLQKLLDQLEKQNRGHRFAVVETSAGGQIAKGSTSKSGASQHFLTGRVLYSLESQKQFLGRKFTENSSLSDKHVRQLAKVMQKESGADWVLAETGMAGPPSPERRSKKNGQCHLGLALSSEVKYKYLELNPFLTRKEHQLLFAIEALIWAESVLNKHN